MKLRKKLLPAVSKLEFRVVGIRGIRICSKDDKGTTFLSSVRKSELEKFALIFFRRKVCNNENISHYLVSELAFVWVNRLQCI